VEHLPGRGLAWTFLLGNHGSGSQPGYARCEYSR
jgi:hypothetical protein